MGQEDEARHMMAGQEKKGHDVDYGHPKTAG